MEEKKMKYALLVDDEQEICQLLSAILRRAGTECAFAHSLAEGRAALALNTYDAVFLDVNLPDGLGYDLIPEIKAARPDACCIAISAMDTEGNRAVAAGADVFIPKPFNRDIIYSSIRDLGFTA
jgi:DNA-binding response OmpR family regulator